MVELFILAGLVALVVLSLRPGRRVVLDEPLIIQCPSQYHITLAPQLQSSQAFIESIAGRFAATPNLVGDTHTLFYQVRPMLLPREQGVYLLAVALRGGMLYFQAINPLPTQREEASQLRQLREFSAAVLLYHPVTELADNETVDRLQREVEDAASHAGIDVRVLH